MSRSSLLKLVADIGCCGLWDVKGSSCFFDGFTSLYSSNEVIFFFGESWYVHEGMVWRRKRIKSNRNAQVMMIKVRETIAHGHTCTVPYWLLNVGVSTHRLTGLVDTIILILCDTEIGVLNIQYTVDARLHCCTHSDIYILQYI